MAAQTALATATSVPVKGKGKGGAGGKGKSTKLEDRLRAVESVIVQHERTIHMLEDRCSMVILSREAIHQKKKIKEFRDLHRRQGEEIKKEDHVALDAAQKAGHPAPGRSTPTGQSAQPSAHICVQRNQCSDAGGNIRQRRSERNAQASDSTARRVLRQIESKARQAKRRKTVGMVADARGNCPYGIESRATSSCAVVKRKSSRTSKRYTNCAAAFTGRKHREEHPERTAETRRRLGDERRRRKRRRRQKWSEAWKKIIREVIPPNSNSNCNWPADACGALWASRRRAQAAPAAERSVTGSLR